MATSKAKKQPLLQRVRMSAAQLKTKEQSTIDFIPCKGKPDTYFFACGSVTGCCEKAVSKAIKNRSLTLDQLIYTETCKPEKDPKNEENWVSSLILKRAATLSL